MAIGRAVQKITLAVQLRLSAKYSSSGWIPAKTKSISQPSRSCLPNPDPIQALAPITRAAQHMSPQQLRQGGIRVKFRNELYN
jgi:hypothetical protein